MKLIAAVSADWGIGKDNQLLFSLPTDMKFFRTMTKGAAVIMGRRTLESFGGGPPRRGREKLVLSRDPSFCPEGVTVVRDLKDLPDRPDAFVIGGEAVYRLLLDRCDTAYITKVDASVPADRFFPDLDALPDWELAEQGEPIEENGLTFRFLTYRRVCPGEAL